MWRTCVERPIEPAPDRVGVYRQHRVAREQHPIAPRKNATCPGEWPGVSTHVQLGRPGTGAAPSGCAISTRLGRARFARALSGRGTGADHDPTVEPVPYRSMPATSPVAMPAPAGSRRRARTAGESQRRASSSAAPSRSGACASAESPPAWTRVRRVSPPRRLITPADAPRAQAALTRRCRARTNKADAGSIQIACTRPPRAPGAARRRSAWCDKTGGVARRRLRRGARVKYIENGGRQALKWVGSARATRAIQGSPPESAARSAGRGEKMLHCVCAGCSGADCGVRGVHLGVQLRVLRVRAPQQGSRLFFHVSLERGGNRARPNQDHLDTEGRELPAHRVVERLDGVLAGGVRAVGRTAEFPASEPTLMMRPARCRRITGATA